MLIDFPQLDPNQACLQFINSKFARTSAMFRMIRTIQVWIKLSQVKSDAKLTIHVQNYFEEV